MSDLPARIKEAADLLGGLKQLAKKTGIPRRTLGNWLQGRKPKPEALQKIAVAAQVDLGWLVTGDGEKFGSPLTALLKKAGESLEREDPSGDDDFQSVFHRAMRSHFGQDVPDRPAQPEVDEAIMERMARVATSVYADLKQRPPAEKVTVEATRLFNRLRQIADIEDATEVELALQLLRYQMKRRLLEAAEFPGTGKHSASLW